MKAVAAIAKNSSSEPIQIGELSRTELIPIKFLEQILLNLKNNGVLKSKRGANGGYLLGLPKNKITIYSIVSIMDGPFDLLSIESNNEINPGLKRCFQELNELVISHLEQFTIQDVIEHDDIVGKMFFEI